MYCFSLSRRFVALAISISTSEALLGLVRCLSRYCGLLIVSFSDSMLVPGPMSSMARTSPLKKLARVLAWRSISAAAVGGA